MSEASIAPGASDNPPTGNQEAPEVSSFTLVVVSPSVGVPGPLTFSQLPITTSVRELKAKLRNTLPSKPADESQRLIHRGRMLARDTETMVEIFGRETVCIYALVYRFYTDMNDAALEPRITNITLGSATYWR